MICAINDDMLIKQITKFGNDIVKTKHTELCERFRKDQSSKDYKTDYNHPLDEEILTLLHDIQPSGSEVEISYEKASQIDELWQRLLEKSIKCLRHFDRREPFLESSAKKPVVYGIDKLSEYHERYSAFEGMLYGSSSYYRDHIFHSIRTWMLGVFCLLNNQVNPNQLLIDSMAIEGEKTNGDANFSDNINFFEKLSTWTIISLCHDLGYPLEKSQQIFDKTRNMMQVFVSNPRVWTDISFNGIQDTINDYIVKFMSSKMKDTKEKKKNTKTGLDECLYHGRVQPKYYLKYIKSLEKYDHGIISAIIIYKMLLYFIESDYNLNEDYTFEAEDARQFYIRREILRAISSHTCPDIYHIKVTTFSCLLMVCDELQEWGRKAWKNLYAGTSPNATQLKIESFSSDSIVVYEIVDMSKADYKTIIENIQRIFQKQYNSYKFTFRDGQDTFNRTFNFKKTLEISVPEFDGIPKFLMIDYEVNHSDKDKFFIDTTNAYDTSQTKIKDDLDDLLKIMISKNPDDEIKFSVINKK